MVRCLQEPSVAAHTLHIPYPYTPADADAFLAAVRADTEAQGRPLTFAIRAPDAQFIGGIGLLNVTLGTSHAAELGYWIVKEYRNRGIVTLAVRAVAVWALDELALDRVSAAVFSFNTASERVLQKAGFQYEGTLRHAYKKDGVLLDGKLYAFTRTV